MKDEQDIKIKQRKSHKIKELVGRAQAAKILGVSTATLDIYRGRGLIKAVPTVGFRTYFLKSKILEYKEVRDKDPNKSPLAGVKRSPCKKASQTDKTPSNDENDNS